MNQVRIELTYELLKALGVFEREDVLLQEPKEVKDEVLRLFHGQEYIDKVKEASDGTLHTGSFIFGLGTGDNPIFKGMYEASVVHVGATIQSTDLVASEKVNHSFSPAGGLHHASETSASGFCIFNDVVIGIKYLMEKYGAKKVAYVDIDSHHGDGVQWAFYTNPNVLTISFHESGRYLFPGSGFVREIGEGEGKGYSVNVPFPPYTRDGSYLKAFREIVPALLSSFKPDCIFTQLGADAHFSDPLTHLMISTTSYREIGKTIHELAHELCGGKWVAVGGGGYDPAAVARVWSILFGQMVGIEFEDELPKEWLTICEEKLGRKPSPRLYDSLEKEEEPNTSKEVEKIVQAVKNEVFPHHGLPAKS